MSQKRFAIILSGCGVYDGAEIHEAVMTMYAVDFHGGTYQLFAPNQEQHHVINHLSGQEMPEKRNVMVESARIARGNIRDLTEYKPEDHDILLIPGGFGAAKNLSSFAFDGPDCSVNTDLQRAILSTHAANKPIGALCIAPVILACVLKEVELTIGQDPETAEALKKMGAKHVQSKQQEVVIDRKNKIVTSPCYMLDSSLVDIAEGAKNAVHALLSL